jgi:N-acetyl-anhydromuramyl-L-alanine amidase AmpD
MGRWEEPTFRRPNPMGMSRSFFPIRRRPTWSGLAALATYATAAAAWSQVASPTRNPATEGPDELGAIWAPAAPTNFAPANRPMDRPIEYVVIHDIEGGAEGAVSWFQNPMSKVSAHYVVDHTGKRVWQQVKERDIGWHAGNSDLNGRSIGIEHDGFAYRPGFFNQALYEGSARLVRDITARYGIPRDRQHIIAHAEVPHPTDPTKRGGRSGHTDPGPFWDWDYYMALVRNDARLEQLAAPTVIHPGEKVQITASLTNTGDDAWPALSSNRQDRLANQGGTVYLGAGPQTATLTAIDSPLYDAATWSSPRFAGVPSATGTAPGQTAALTFTVLGLRTLGDLAEQFRLTRVPAAPKLPVPFGPTLAVRMRVEPWQIDLDSTDVGFEAAGWDRRDDDGRTLFSHRFHGKNDETPPARWNAVLPVSGTWEVLVRSGAVSGHTKNAVYTVQTAAGPQAVTVSQKKAGEWQSLGRFYFGGAKPKTTVTLSGEPGRGGTVVAGDLRFAGPFPTESAYIGR